jgi:type IV pilus assembly protein PilX
MACTRRFDPDRRLTPQRGAVLVVGLIFLAMLTLMGVAAYSVATQEERMTGNSRDRTRAFEAAEAALRECEAQVDSKLNPATTFSNTGGNDGNGVVGGFYVRLPPVQPSYADQNYAPLWWWQAGSNVKAHVLTPPNSAELSNRPICIAESFDVDPGVITSAGKPIKTVPMARIAAHGWGISQDTQVTLQSTYLR